MRDTPGCPRNAVKAWAFDLLKTYDREHRSPIVIMLVAMVGVRMSVRMGMTRTVRMLVYVLVKDYLKLPPKSVCDSAQR